MPLWCVTCDGRSRPVWPAGHRRLDAPAGLLKGALCCAVWCMDRPGRGQAGDGWGIMERRETGAQRGIPVVVPVGAKSAPRALRVDRACLLGCVGCNCTRDFLLDVDRGGCFDSACNSMMLSLEARVTTCRARGGTSSACGRTKWPTRRMLMG